MAGVRNDGALKPVAEAKGIPEDITFLTRFCYDQQDGDLHHASWLGAEEIQRVIEQHFVEDVWEAEDWFGYLFGNGWRGYSKYPEDRPEKLEDIRWVFWFDN